MSHNLRGRLARLERSDSQPTDAQVDNVLNLLERLQADGMPLADALGFPDAPPMTPKPRGGANTYDVCAWLIHTDAGHDTTGPGGVCLTCQPT